MNIQSGGFFGRMKKRSVGRASPGQDRKLNRPQPRPTLPTTLNRFLVLVLSLLFVIGAAARERPYKGEAQGVIVESNFIATPELGGPPFLVERAVAEGNFTHVGRTRITLEWHISAALIHGQVVYVIEGRFSMTTSAKDSMLGRFRSWQRESALESEILVNVEEGTGKFRNARGIIPGVGVKVGDAFSYSLDGKLDY